MNELDSRHQFYHRGRVFQQRLAHVMPRGPAHSAQNPHDPPVPVARQVKQACAQFVLAANDMQDSQQAILGVIRAEGSTIIELSANI